MPAALKGTFATVSVAKGTLAASALCGSDGDRFQGPVDEVGE
jgi:hypothetical protein